MLHKKRYVVTGVGAICSLGNNVDEVWGNIVNGVCGISSLKSIDTTKAYTDKGGEIKNFNLSVNMDEKYINSMDYSSLICLEATNEALRQSKLEIDKEDKERIAVVIGSCTGGIRSTEKFNRDLISDDRNIDASDIIKIPLNRISRNIALFLGSKGVATNIANACAASNIAISYACDLIERGNVDIAVVGGTDGMATLQFAGFHSLQALAQEYCSPFSKSDGINLGEGAGILVIESYEHAVERKANILCEIVGYGVTSDASHITAPRNDGEQQLRVMATALELSGMEIQDIDYLNAHGTGTSLNDKIEKECISKFFADVKNNIKISSTKSMIGHCLGAASALEAVFCIKAIEDKIVPPTINYDDNINDELNFIPNKSEKSNVSTAISNSFAFGGSNSSVIFSDRLDRDINIVKNDEDDKIYITGIGCLSSIGESLNDYVNSINNNISGIKEVHYEEDLYNGRYAAKVNINKETMGTVSKKFLRRLDRLSKLLLLAGCQAIDDGELDIEGDIEEEIGLIVGTSDGPIGDIRDFQETVIKEGIKSANAIIFPNTVYNASAGYLSINKNIKGNTATLVNGMASGIDSLCYGYDLLKLGRRKYMLTAGYDEYNETTHLLYDKLNLLYSGQYENKPIESYEKSGLVLSEGSTALLLERRSNAIKRKAKVYAEVAGYSILNDPCKASNVTGKSLILDKAIREACKKSGIRINEIDAIVGFRNGIKEVDKFEHDSYTNVFGDDLKNIEIHNIKSLVGEGRAATSSLQVLHAVALLNNLIKLDENNMICKNYNANCGKVLKNILVTSFSFGGGVSTVILRKI